MYFAGARQWQVALDGGKQVPAEITTIFGLKNTARERLTACELFLRRALIWEEHSIRFEHNSPRSVSTLRDHADQIRSELRAAEFARCQLSTGVRDVEVERRILQALATPWYALPAAYEPFTIVENKSYEALRKIERRYYEKRRKEAARRRLEFPDPIFPLQIDDSEMFPIEDYVTYVQPVQVEKTFGVIEGDHRRLLDVTPYDFALPPQDLCALDDLQKELEEECEWKNWTEPPLLSSVNAPLDNQVDLNHSQQQLDEHANEEDAQYVDSTYQIVSGSSSNPVPIEPSSITDYERDEVETCNESHSFKEFAQHVFIRETNRPQFTLHETVGWLTETQLNSLTFAPNAQALDSKDFGSGIYEEDSNDSSKVVQEKRHLDQTVLHPKVRLAIRSHDRAKKAFIEEQDKCPQVFCNDTVALQIGNCETEGGPLTVYGYAKPRIAYPGAELHCGEKTWMTTTFLQLQHANCLANMCIRLNSSQHDLIDAALSSAHVYFNSSDCPVMTHYEEYLLGLFQQLRNVTDEQTASLVESGCHAKFVLRDSVNRFVSEDIRKQIHCQPFLQGDQLYLPIDEVESDVEDLAEHFRRIGIYDDGPENISFERSEEMQEKYGLLQPSQIATQADVVEQRKLDQLEPKPSFKHHYLFLTKDEADKFMATSNQPKTFSNVSKLPVLTPQVQVTLPASAASPINPEPSTSSPVDADASAASTSVTVPPLPAVDSDQDSNETFSEANDSDKEFIVSDESSTHTEGDHSFEISDDADDAELEAKSDKAKSNAISNVEEAKSGSTTPKPLSASAKRHIALVKQEALEFCDVEEDELLESDSDLDDATLGLPEAITWPKALRLCHYNHKEARTMLRENKLAIRVQQKKRQRHFVETTKGTKRRLYRPRICKDLLREGVYGFNNPKENGQINATARTLQNRLYEKLESCRRFGRKSAGSFSPTRSSKTGGSNIRGENEALKDEGCSSSEATAIDEIQSALEDEDDASTTTGLSGEEDSSNSERSQHSDVDAPKNSAPILLGTISPVVLVKTTSGFQVKIEAETEEAKTEDGDFGQSTNTETDSRTGKEQIKAGDLMLTAALVGSKHKLNESVIGETPAAKRVCKENVKMHQLL